MKNIVKNYETVNLFRIRFRKIAYKKKIWDIKKNIINI